MGRQTLLTYSEVNSIVAGGWAWLTSDGPQCSGEEHGSTSNETELHAVLQLLLAMSPHQRIAGQSDNEHD